MGIKEFREANKLEGQPDDVVEAMYVGNLLMDAISNRDSKGFNIAYNPKRIAGALQAHPDYLRDPELAFVYDGWAHRDPKYVEELERQAAEVAAAAKELEQGFEERPRDPDVVRADRQKEEEEIKIFVEEKIPELEKLEQEIKDDDVATKAFREYLKKAKEMRDIGNMRMAYGEIFRAQASLEISRGEKAKRVEEIQRNQFADFMWAYEQGLKEAGELKIGVPDVTSKTASEAKELFKKGRYGSACITASSARDQLQLHLSAQKKLKEEQTPEAKEVPMAQILPAPEKQKPINYDRNSEAFTQLWAEAARRMGSDASDEKFRKKTSKRRLFSSELTDEEYIALRNAITSEKSIATEAGKYLAELEHQKKVVPPSKLSLNYKILEEIPLPVFDLIQREAAKLVASKKKQAAQAPVAPKK